MKSEATLSGSEDSTPLRLFVAITVPASIQATLTAALADLLPLGDVRWVSADRLHLTLKFLGETPVKKIAPLKEELQRIANNCLHFTIGLDGIGAFPGIKRPQTLWYGLSGDTHSLTELASEIESAAERLDFERERRPFRPHLTVGRVRSSRGLRELATELERCARDPLPEAGHQREWKVNSFSLIRSDLKPAGPLYTELAIFPLGPTRPEGKR